MRWEIIQNEALGFFFFPAFDVRLRVQMAFLLELVERGRRLMVIGSVSFT